MESQGSLHKTYIGAGSNLSAKSAVQAIARSAQELARFGMVRTSATYRTSGVGVKSAGMIYHNAVFELVTTLDKTALTTELKRYEDACGRDRSSLVIPIDLDLVVYDGEVLRPGDFSHSYFQTGYMQLTQVSNGEAEGSR